MPIPQPDLAAFIAQYAKPYDPATDSYRRPPFAQPVKAGKATAIYNAHSYHTKVPPQGIEPYIEHYTDPSDLVLDPFCGSGMTGVAALKLGRRVILNDLSPAAAHIAYNYCTPVDVQALKQEFERIKNSIKEEFDYLYTTTCDRCSNPATILHTVWSAVYECGRCNNPITLWDVAVDLQKGKVHQTFACPNCSKEWRKSQLLWIKTKPVLVHYECQHCKPKRNQHPVTPAEEQLIQAISSDPIPYWYPQDELNSQWEMYIRGALHRRKITQAEHLYTRRTLRALSRLWYEFNLVSDHRLAAALRFAFTSTLVTSTIMTRYNMGKRGNGPMSGLLYVPSLSVENNIGLTMSRKAEDVANAFSEMAAWHADNSFIGMNRSATNLPANLEHKIDSVDPILRC